jgi:Tfp pilus assembly protein PilF
LIVVLHFTGDVGRAGALLRERLALMRRSDAYLDADGLDEIRNLGFTARGWGEYETASELWERAVVHYLQTGDRGSAARIRVWLALLEREQGRYARARTILEESLGVSQELEDPEGIATALVVLGDVARDQGDAEQTIAFSERGLALTRERGDTLMMGYSLHNLALAAWMQGDHARAEQLLEEALTVVAADCLGGDSKSEVLISSGVVALDGGKTTHAEQAFVQSLQFVRGRNLVWLAAPALEGMAGVAARHGETPRAAHLLGAADGLRSRMGTPVMPLHRPLYDRHVAAARGALGAERFEALCEEGQAMTVEQAFALALDGLPSMHGSLPTPPIPA